MWKGWNKCFKKNEEISYTALGDSVSLGFGASERSGYVSKFHRFLKSIFEKVIFTNKSFPGMVSPLLLLQLTVGVFTRRAVKKADVLTISAGGANVALCRRKNGQIICKRCADSGVRLFEHDWPLILKKIRKKLRCDAKIYVNTLFNPYREDEPNFLMADQYIQRINRAILNPAYRDQYEYEVIDLYSHFKGMVQDEWKVCRWTHFCGTIRDVHPNDFGHEEIFQLLKSRFHNECKNDGY
ncbi:SGNH/GDSL hydrolase family protein [Pseudalkalibacillus caeni]|uniref:SGNH/GDSL hydrolase family protein n=1 Tax=Exobacillus caeni TaxID=2574798 RepID=UPI00148567E6|nr:SGNH/GDSL hydrolase family protein [Pseudalkalibacillus caeni]